MIDLQGIAIVRLDLWDHSANKNVHLITMDPTVTVDVFVYTMVPAIPRMVLANVQLDGPDLLVNSRVHLSDMG